MAGAFVAQTYLYTYGDTLAGAVLSGTSSRVALRVRAMYLAAHAERKRLGPHGSSRLLRFLSFGDFNIRFRPNRTHFDWLSRDQAEVDKYIADPRCGIDISTQAWVDIMIANDREAARARVPKHLPIYIFSGQRDPRSAATVRDRGPWRRRTSAQVSRM